MVQLLKLIYHNRVHIITGSSSPFSKCHFLFIVCQRLTFSYNDINSAKKMLRLYRKSQVKKDELRIWSLKIFCFQIMLARNCVLVFLEHHRLTQHG